MTQFHSGLSGDITGFVQQIPGKYKTEKTINNTGIDKIDIKCDCITGSIVNGIREPICIVMQ